VQLLDHIRRRFIVARGDAIKIDGTTPIGNITVAAPTASISVNLQADSPRAADPAPPTTTATSTKTTHVAPPAAHDPLDFR